MGIDQIVVAGLFAKNLPLFTYFPIAILPLNPLSSIPFEL